MEDLTKFQEKLSGKHRTKTTNHSAFVHHVAKEFISKGFVTSHLLKIQTQEYNTTQTHVFYWNFIKQTNTKCQVDRKENIYFSNENKCHKTGLMVVGGPNADKRRQFNVRKVNSERQINSNVQCVVCNICK